MFFPLLPLFLAQIFALEKFLQQLPASTLRDGNLESTDRDDVAAISRTLPTVVDSPGVELLSCTLYLFIFFLQSLPHPLVPG